MLAHEGQQLRLEELLAAERAPATRPLDVTQAQLDEQVIGLADSSISAYSIAAIAAREVDSCIYSKVCCGRRMRMHQEQEGKQRKAWLFMRQQGCALTAGFCLVGLSVLL